MLTPLPTPPSTSDPANFATRADALVIALANMVSEINGGALTLAGGILTGNITSTGNPSINIGSGSLTAGAISGTTGAFSGALGVNGAGLVSGSATFANQNYLLWYDAGTSGATTAYIRGTGGSLVINGTHISLTGIPTAAGGAAGTIYSSGGFIKIN